MAGMDTHAEIDRKLDELEIAIDREYSSAFALGFFSGAIATAVIALAGYALLDKQLDAEVTAQIEQEAHERKLQTLAAMPLDCDATVRQSVAGVVVREGCYHRATSARKWDAP